MTSLVGRFYSVLPVEMQSAACSAVGLWRRLDRYSRPFRDVLDCLMHTQWLSHKELQRLQMCRVRGLIEYAVSNVPQYRELGLDPPCDLRDFPVLEKASVRFEPPRLKGEGIPPWRIRRGQTSGTTGTALRLWHERRALVEEFATVWRLRRNAGVERGMRRLTFAGRSVVPIRQTEPPFWRFNAAGNQMLFSAYHATSKNLAAYAGVLREQTPPYYVEGYPSFIHLMSLYLLENDISVLPPIAIFTSSESLLAWQRHRIERAFGAPVRDRYGVGEFCVSMAECERGRLHVDEEFCVVELDGILEEDEDTQTGSLLCTGLADRGVAFIRYRIGDIGTRYREPCECGRASTTFRDIDGRQEDYVVTPEGSIVSRMDHVFKGLHSIMEAQIVQDEKWRLRVRVVRSPEYSDGDERALLKELRQRLGERIEIEIDYVPRIPRTNQGKLRAVISSVLDRHDPFSVV